VSSVIRIGVESTSKKSFASALDWPGWSRSGKTPALAVEALLAYAPRYAEIARRAGVAFAANSMDGDVLQTLDGDATTAFGAPSITFDADRAATDAAESGRLAALLRAAWDTFDAIAAAAPAELRKGPRGGGRDTAKVVDHVVAAEQAYARQVGITHKAPDATDLAAVAAVRVAIREPLAVPSNGEPLAKWTQRYAARRIAWHVLDHAWEIEDRSA
jgi:hypothetical protein